MKAEQRALIEWECVRLSGAFSYYLDTRNYTALAELFAPDGIWVRLGTVLQGTGEILDAMAKRAPTQFTRHVTCNHHFTHVGKDTASAVAHTMTYFSHELTAEIEAGTEVRRFEAENVMPLDVFDDYVRTKDGWRFAKRVVTPYMLPDRVRPMLAAAHG